MLSVLKAAARVMMPTQLDSVKQEQEAQRLELADLRAKMIERLLADVRADLMICKTDSLEQIKNVVNFIGGSNR